MALANRTVVIPKNIVREDLLVELKGSLTYADERGVFAKNPLVAYSETSETITVPRIAGFDFCRRHSIPLVDDAADGDIVDISFKGALRDVQRPAVDAALRALSTPPNGATMNLYCGAGKTTCALYVSCALRRKTLVLVHTSALANQWKARIEQFVENASVGAIRGSVIDVEGRTHCIALMQTVYRRTGPKALSEQIVASFGLLVVDETHHVGAECLSTCLALVGSKRRLGLSATLQRKDGATDFTFASVGPVCYELKREGSGATRVFAVRTGTNVDVSLIHRGSDSVPNVSRAINDLSADEDRTQLVFAWIVKCARVKRQTIVLCDRRALVDRIGELLDGRSVPHAKLIGGATEEDRVNSQGSPVILATYAFASEGLDIASLDTCVLATPRRDVVQCVGRILRVHPGKKSPLVIDFVDERVSIFANQFRARKKYYKSSRLAAIVTEYDGLEERLPVQGAKVTYEEYSFAPVKKPKREQTEQTLDGWLKK